MEYFDSRGYECAKEQGGESTPLTEEDREEVDGWIAFAQMFAQLAENEGNNNSASPDEIAKIAKDLEIPKRLEELLVEYVQLAGKSQPSSEESIRIGELALELARFSKTHHHSLIVVVMASCLQGRLAR